MVKREKVIQTRTAIHKPLPKGWKWVRLGEVAICLDERRIPVNEVEREKRKGNIPYYGANGQVGWIDDYLFDQKLLLVAEDGGFWNAYEPSSYIINGKSWVNNHAHVLAENGNALLEFLNYYFYLTDIRKYISGTTRGKLNKQNFLNIPIPLPSLPIQHKIVEVLEEADNLRKLRQQADEKMKDLIPSLFVQMFGDPATNSKKWEIKSLEEVCIKITDGSHRTPKLLNTGYPFLTVTNINNGDFDYTNVNYISEEDFKDLVKNDCKPLKSDVLFSKDGTIGKVIEIKEEKEIAILSSLAILRPSPNLINSTYLAKVATSDFFINQAKGKQSGSALRRIILRSLKSVKIPLPPFPLQQEFAKLVEDIETEKQRQAESRKKLDELFQSLMQRAFTGKLVS